MTNEVAARRILLGRSALWAFFGRYLLFVAPASLLWETLHLPLYTLWTEGSIGEKAFAVVHCTA
ncbi:MAG: hypothetical protein GWN84_26630, partial [Gammaproteobacteria bacterium]|nr:hypothetical protein [Gammaproteobacteria bacterium]NIR85973.1 hypothetical protein [Gammaproteobacteria bacterium]NIR91964.1 hypothetical protein [Gammaproteobacteria bacterium]NIU07214.1 hypothetical protein [Gammaproteobacteria bacterium]NIV74215.1 hypothetical protein [Gammaproteobacteria bacterium]